MDDREIAENAFREADRANAKPNIDKLVLLANMYKSYIRQNIYTHELLKQYKDALKDSGFKHDDVVAVVTLMTHDPINKYIIREAGEIKESNND